MTYLKRVILFLLFSTWFNGQSQEVEHLLCNDYWITVDFQYFNLRSSHFNFQGEEDHCIAQSNKSYPFDEGIHIVIRNQYESKAALENYNTKRTVSETIYGFMDVYNLGDEAFAVLNTEFGQLESILIEVVKGQYAITFEISGNTAARSNNRFNKETVLEFARTVVSGL